MSPERLLKHFEQITEAPDAVPRLRQFILDLAVRGRLVPQNPDDEPASELLSRIDAEMDQRAKIGETRKKQSFPPIEDGDVLFEIPKNWKWVRLGSIGDWGSGCTPPRGNNEYFGGGITWLKSGELEDKIELVGSQETITEKALQRCSFRVNKTGDVLIAMYGATIGKLAILGETAVTNQAVCGCTPFGAVYNRYLFTFLLSQREYFHSQSEGGAQPNISKIKIVNFGFALPPLAEQHRILTRVDELMALCDKLEAAQAKREKRRDRLVASTLHGLNNGDASPAPGTRLSFKDSARFYLNHLPRLTTRLEHIHQLRQTILNLAVRGKLVPQEPNDEPVTGLLQRIDQERIKAAEKDRRAEAPVQELLADELRWSVPLSWGWRGLADLVLFIDYRGKTPTKTDSGIRLITAKNVRKGFINLAPEEFITKATYDGWMTRGLPREGDILFTTEAPIGNAATVRLQEKFGLAQRVINFRPYGGLDSDFIVLQLLSMPFQAIIDTVATGLTAKGIKAGKLKRLPLAIPPLSEQRRIVAKVHELMALCDELEKGLATKTATRLKLLEATLQEALAL